MQVHFERLQDTAAPAEVQEGLLQEYFELLLGHDGEIPEVVYHELMQELVDLQEHEGLLDHEVYYEGEQCSPEGAGGGALSTSEGDDEAEFW